VSFAGEDRDFVEEVAIQLRAAGVVFYALLQEAELWPRTPASVARRPGPRGHHASDDQAGCRRIHGCEFPTCEKYLEIKFGIDLLGEPDRL